MARKLELKLENIGLVREASIDISGLTVITGKNDQGKSTVGKSFMAFIKANNRALSKASGNGGVEYWGKAYLDEMIDYIFDSEISSSGKISICVGNDEKYAATIKYNKCESFKTILPKENRDKEFVDCTFIQTPLIWDLEELFNAIDVLRGDETFSYDNFEIRYPYILRDLYAKLTLSQRKVRGSSINEQIKNNIRVFIRDLIGGEFVKKRHNKIHRFYSTNKDLPTDISLKDVAIGMKTFGIIQVLIEQNCFTSQGFFIFDEPENHLHPDWQLKLAIILTTLVKNGIHIMVNTHSPFILHALNQCAEILSIPYSIYWAEDGWIKNYNNKKWDIHEKLLKILSEPEIRALENELLTINKIT